MTLTYHTLRPRDYRELEAQPSQAGLALGMGEPNDDELEAYCAQPVAWAVRRAGRLIACFGIVETFAGTQGWGWARLAAGIGHAHLELTRFIRGQAEACGLARLELLARAPDLESEIKVAEWGAQARLDPGQVVALALRRATPEIRWAVLLGFTPAHLLRRYGAHKETFMLFERLG